MKYIMLFQRHHLLKTTISFILLFFSSPSFSQINYKSGSITLSNGTVLNGFIDYREWLKNPKTIHFSKTENSSAEKYSVSDLLSFKVTGGETYVKAIVQKDMRPVDLSTLSEGNKLLITSETDTVFLRLINSCSDFSLFLLNDFKNHFYIKEPEGNYEELIYQVFIDEKRTANFLVRKSLFRNQLEKYIIEKTNHSKLKKKLENLEYNEKELSGFVSLLSSEGISKETRNEKNKAEFFVSTGLHLSSMKVTGPSSLSDHNFSQKAGPVFSAGFDLFSKRNRSDFILRTELSYFNLNYSSKYTRSDFTGYVEETFSLKSGNIKPSVSFLYCFTRGADNRIYGGVDVGYTFSSYSKNQFTRTSILPGEPSTYDNYMKCVNSWINLSLKAGFIFKKNFEIKSTALLWGSFANYANINVRPNLYDIQVAYRFRK
ncbi:MAG: hypothetical protein QM725_14490 [Lacibacter sp.]